MIHLWFFICFWFSFGSSQQYYDHTLCSSNTDNPGTRYNCSSSTNPCQTFIIFRANDQFPTISTISSLFKVDSNSLISINSNVSTSTQVLETGHEVIIPITCSCVDEFYQANFTYTVTQNETLSDIACGTFEGLVKSITLADENGNDVRSGSILCVPLKCACPSSNGGGKYLITYPFIEGDDTRKVSEKFNVSVEDIWKANHLVPTPTVYPNTTILVPLKDKPFINFDVQDSDPPTQFLPTKPVDKKPKISSIYIAGSALGFLLILALLISCGLYLKALKKFRAENIPFTHRISSMNSCSSPFSGPPTRSSTNSCLSPDILVGIKYSLCNYSIDELKQATKNFSEDTKISNSIYRGLLDNGEVMIKHVRFERTRQVIDVHSRINHVNIVKLQGVCYNEDDSYLIFEYPFNGSLRDILSNTSCALHWLRRTQIACDIATGLHYLHYSVTPGYNHLSLNSKNIFLNSKWRAKITVFGTSLTSPSGWIAPEYAVDGIVTEKVDIFAFGVILIELISGKEAVDGKLVRECIRFLGGGANEGGCFDQLRKFVDPCLKDDYPLAEALCLAVLAGSCVEDDPLHRPSMDDVLKILARMV